MKYVVTGGFGFIGSILVKRLLSEGNEVMVIDDLSTGSVDNLPKDFPRLNKISWIIDIKNTDGIFHLGIPCSSPLYRENRFIIGKTISEFIEIMEYAKKNKVKVVFASTASIYNGNNIPYREDMSIIVADFYAEVRFTMERLAEVYHKFYDVKVIALRPFSVYGPGERSKGIYANLISQLGWAKQSGEMFDIYNEGKGLRDFTHVNDVVEAFILAMNSNIDFDILNVGTGKVYEMNQIIEVMGLKNFRYTDFPGVKNFKTPDTCADMSKTKSLLGFESKIDVIEYLKNLKL